MICSLGFSKIFFSVYYLGCYFLMSVGYGGFGGSRGCVFECVCVSSFVGMCVWLVGWL